MNKFPVFLIIIFALIACQNKYADINILTDDLLIYDVADEFNRHNEIKANVTYIECSDSDVFAKYQDQTFSNIDLVIGHSNTNNITNYKLYKKNFISKESLLSDNYINRFYNKNFGYFIPYSADWNVLVLNKSTQIDNSGDFVTFDNLKSLMNDKVSKNKIIFIPQDSVISLQEYMFMLGGGINVTEEYTNFNTKQNETILNMYLNFDKTYNQSEENREMVLQKYINVDKKYFLKKNIILFEIFPLSKAMLIPSDKYEFYFFDNMNTASFKEKKIGITKNNINMIVSQQFIDFLTSYKTQKSMFRSTMTQTLTKMPVHIPVTLSDNTEDIVNYDDFDFINKEHIDSLHKVLNNLTPADFINEKIKTNFLEAYNFSESVIANGQLDRADMLTHITESLNKK